MVHYWEGREFHPKTMCLGFKHLLYQKRSGRYPCCQIKSREIQLTNELALTLPESRSPTTIQMFRSYFIVALRSFLRNKLTSFINIFGLTLGLTTGIIICLVLVYAFGFDRFHAHYKDIHLVEMNQFLAGNISTGNATSTLLGPAIQSGIPGMKYVVRTRNAGENLTRYGDKLIYQRCVYVEPDFFRMMTFPAIEGNPVSTLQEGSGVVITEIAARRLFGAGSAMGKTILLNNTFPLKVGAVIQDIPQNSTIRFDLALPFSLFAKDHQLEDSWNCCMVQTWLQLQPGASVGSINRQMTHLLLKKSHFTEVSLFAYPITRLELYDNFRDGKPYWGKAYLFVLIGFIAFLTLLIACINFMNLSTAMAERRAREVGVRKVLGASRRIIIGQFLGEAVLLAMAALLLSVGLAFIALPWFASFAHLPLANQLGHPWVWVLIAGIGIFTGLVAGSYPAIYLSRFQPAKVLKRLMSTGRKGAFLRKALVTVQFVISVFLVVTTIVGVKQLRHVADRPLGFETSNLIDIAADGKLPQRFDLFKAQVQHIPGVINLTASSSNLLGVSLSQAGLEWPGKQPDQDFIIAAMWVQYDWTKTTGLKLAEGRDFSPDYGADSSACLINQSAARKMALREPVIGTTIAGRRVIGVLQDFPIGPFGKSNQPLIVYFGSQNLDHFLIRLANDVQWKKHLSQIKNAATTLNPGYPFTWQFTDEELKNLFKKDYDVEQLANIFSVLAVLISCMGLFGLASFAVERRTKEISIRKVLGASAGGLWLSLALDMLKPVFFGFIVATPLAAMTSSALLKVNDYHISLSWWIFAVAGAGAILVTLATVSYHAFRAAQINPAAVLSTE